MPEWWDGSPSALYRRVFGIGGTLALFLFLFFLTKVKKGPPANLSSDAKEGDDEKDVPLRPINQEELKSHGHRLDLWMAVDGVVCDLTEFVESHPGGSQVLLEHAGAEAGEAFREVGHTAFARSIVRKRAVGILARDSSPLEENSVTESTESVSKDTDKLVNRIMTKDDRFNVHKLLGLTVLALYLYHIAVAVLYLNADGEDHAGFRPNWQALATCWAAMLLQVSSFIFRVPRNRPLGAPMIWQEWRMHNLIFVSRLVLCFTFAWLSLRFEAPPQGRYLQLVGNNLALLAQLFLTDLATKYLREDSHESLTSTMPYWEGCPQWVEGFFKTYYTGTQVMTSYAISWGMASMDIFFLMILPYQLYSFLMTMVRKRLISTRTCHLTYFWSLVQVWICYFCQMNVVALVVTSAIILLLLVTRFTGFNKYLLWLGCMVPAHLGILFYPPIFTVTSLDCLYYSIPIMLASWFVLACLQKTFTRIPVFDSRHSRYVEARPKPVVLASREEVGSSLVLLRFKIPGFWRMQGFSSGLSPGQHVRLLCPNPSKGVAAWNGHENMEASLLALSRSYSPVSASNNRTLDFLVKHYPADEERGFPNGGRASQFLISELKVGGQVWLSGPHGAKVYRGGGTFIVDGRVVKARVCCALAGGSGITPALATLRECREECHKSVERWGKAPEPGQCVREFAVLHASHSPEEALTEQWYQPAEEAGLAPSCRVLNLATAAAAGAAEPAEAEGVHKSRCGKLTKEVVEDAFPAPGEDIVVLLCGPKGFVDDLCRPLLREMGYDNVIVMW